MNSVVNLEKVIILNATELGYQVINALGKNDIRSIVIYDQEKDEIGRYSKYVLESIKIPNFIEEPRLLLQFLMDKKEFWKGTLIIPTKDYGVEFLSQHKDTLSPHYLIPTPDADVTAKIINKKLLYRYAKEIGITVPKIFHPQSLEEIVSLKDHLTFPCLLKPALGHLFFRAFDFKMLEIKTYDELVAHYEHFKTKVTHNGFELMISEIIPGEDSKNMIQYVSYLDQSGELLASMTTRKIRQDPPLYGQGRIVRSEKTHQVEQLSLKLLRELKYYGFSEIEWKYDQRDGKFKLIEINPRFIFYIGLCEGCGINFPYIQYLDLVHHKKIKPNSYKDNIYWIHLYKDILHTIINHKMEDLTLWEYLTPYLKKHVFAVLNFRDLNPFYQQWKQHISNMIKKRYSSYPS